MLGTKLVISEACSISRPKAADVHEVFGQCQRCIHNLATGQLRHIDVIFNMIAFMTWIPELCIILARCTHAEAGIHMLSDGDEPVLEIFWASAVEEAP